MHIQELRLPRGLSVAVANGNPKKVEYGDRVVARYEDFFRELEGEDAIDLLEHPVLFQLKLDLVQIAFETGMLTRLY